jgi:hypothetical protein
MLEQAVEKIHEPHALFLRVGNNLGKFGSHARDFKLPAKGVDLFFFFHFVIGLWPWTSHSQGCPWLLLIISYF